MVSEEWVQKAKGFHGHMCPGLAIGIRASEIALAETGPHAEDEEVVAVVETDMCGVDAIQVLTGCTFGKGNLIFLDYGKNAFTFYRRSDGKGIRIVAKPLSVPCELRQLQKRLVAGPLSPEEQGRLAEIQSERTLRIMEAPLEDLFDVRASEAPIPRRARILEAVTCAVCGESLMESRARGIDGKTLCIPCFDPLDRRL